MTIIGSRCGGHDFFVELPNNDPLWIGATENSDLDILLKAGEERPKIKGLIVDVWVGGVAGQTGIYRAPYSIDGEVFIPNDLRYLQRVAKKRIRNKYGVKFLKTIWGRDINFLKSDGSFFTRQTITRSL